MLPAAQGRLAVTPQLLALLYAPREVVRQLCKLHDVWQRELDQQHSPGSSSAAGAQRSTPMVLDDAMVLFRQADGSLRLRRIQQVLVPGVHGR